MIAKNTTRDQLEQALKAINAPDQYAGNITWRRAPEVMNNAGDRFRFTLRAVDSRGKGGRISHNGRRIGQSACWHAHGYFFEELFKVAPEAVILAGSKTITKDAGNWEDRNIGSMMQPMMYSDACDCNK